MVLAYPAQGICSGGQSCRGSWGLLSDININLTASLSSFRKHGDKIIWHLLVFSIWLNYCYRFERWEINIIMLSHLYQPEPPSPSSPSPPSSAQSSPTLYLLAWLKLHLKCRTNTWLAFLLNGVNWCHRLILKKKKKELGYSLERSLSMGCSRIRRKTLRCAVFPWKCKHIRFILQRFLQDRVSTRDWNRLRSSWLNA